MISARTLDLLDRLTWILIYGGLILVVLAFATGSASTLAAWSMAVPGVVAVVAGVVLIAIRPRLDAELASAQSAEPPEQAKQ